MPRGYEDRVPLLDMCETSRCALYMLGEKRMKTSWKEEAEWQRAIAEVYRWLLERMIEESV